MKSKKQARDASKIVKNFMAALEADAGNRGLSDKYILGYLESFVAMHAGDILLDAMERRFAQPSHLKSA